MFRSIDTQFQGTMSREAGLATITSALRSAADTPRRPLMDWFFLRMAPTADTDRNCLFHAVIIIKRIDLKTFLMCNRVDVLW